MSSENSDVCIVVVTYKRSALLSVLLTSIAALTVKPAHVVIVDNASGDDTGDVVSAFAKEFGESKVTYALQDSNTGGSGGFSAGVDIAYARGSEWIWVMDDDVAVEPDALVKLEPWMAKFRVVQGRRRDYDGSPFYWQYQFNTRFGIPNPVAKSEFDESGYKTMNTACFEGGMFHRSIVQQIGLPDPRFFIYWDDTIYGYLASKVTTCVLVDEFVMRRTREIKQAPMGKVRHLNGTSDMVRYHIMRNRGFMARYFAEHGDFHRAAFAFGTFLTFSKELIRIILIDHSFRSGLSALRKGMRDARVLKNDPAWTPMPRLQ